MESLQGYIDAIVYTQPENGFTVARLKEKGKKDHTVIVGVLPGVQPGETVRCGGTWKTHPSYGRQFDVTEFEVESPADLVGIQKYLESGLIKGIGPIFAKRIIDLFGLDTLKVIDETPERLKEIEGLGSKRYDSILLCWKEQRSIREVMLFLRTHGVSPAYAQRIYKTYGEKSIVNVRENPYRLAKDIFGIGFKLADNVAQKLGFALYSSQRISAGLEHVLWALSQEGHTCYPRADLTPHAKLLLEVDEALIEKEITALVENQSFIEKDGTVWLAPYFAYEQGIARDLVRVASSPILLRSIDALKAMDWVQEQLRIQFAPQQKSAVLRALHDKIHIITGGPGTGKSTITNAILTITRKLTDKICLAAPTGRAAKRLSQITRSRAVTIHSLLEVDFGTKGFKRNRDNPLDCDLLVIDEASMIDTALLFHLLRATPKHARLIFIGDIDQLPSVGAGAVLKDLIDSQTIGVTRLTEIFRQAKGSAIITNAHRINLGEFPQLFTSEDSDFHFIEAETPESIQKIILELVSFTIPHKWGINPVDDIQVLSPMKRGIVGSELLNEALQNLLNPGDRSLCRAGRTFRAGDKVMQLSNNYTKNVYNGDIGRIHSIDSEAQEVTVLFDDRSVTYDYGELDELTLAYATSVHKYQGSECPCIIMPIHGSHFKLLQRNLLYTAVTRGKKWVYLVGSKQAVGIAVRNHEVLKRHTGLRQRLVESKNLSE